MCTARRALSGHFQACERRFRARGGLVGKGLGERSERVACSGEEWVGYHIVFAPGSRVAYSGAGRRKGCGPVILPLDEIHPQIGRDVLVAPGSYVMGRVELAD